MDAIDALLLRVFAVSALCWSALALPMSRRVIVAWLTYITMRRRFTRQSQRRWLWITTLREANGEKWRR